MTPTRRQFIKLSAYTAISSLLSGCITTALYEHERYSEDVQSLLISENRRHIIVMTEKYHYIFEAPRDVLLAMSDPYRSFVTIQFGNPTALRPDFYVKSSGAIEGSYTLSLSTSAPTELQESASQAGFSPSKEHDSEGKRQLELHGKLQGHRYKSNSEKTTLPNYRLRSRHVISIEAEPSPTRIAANIAVTPITVAADGVVTIASAAAIVVCIPFAAIGVGFFFGVLAADQI